MPKHALWCNQANRTGAHENCREIDCTFHDADRAAQTIEHGQYALRKQKE